MYIQGGTWSIANICYMHSIMQPPHKTRTALAVFCTLIFLSSPAEVAQISLCPTGYGEVEWNNCLGVYYFPDGTKYVGQFRENKFHGWGAIVWHRKGVCLGCFNSGVLVGRCLFPPSKIKEDRLMRTEISSQEEFERIRSKFDYSEYRKFSEAYIHFSYIIYRITFGGTTEGGFLLVFYRITFVDQDFPSPPTCLDLPRLA